MMNRIVRPTRFQNDLGIGGGGGCGASRAPGSMTSAASGTTGCGSGAIAGGSSALVRGLLGIEQKVVEERRRHEPARDRVVEPVQTQVVAVRPPRPLLAEHAG